jgi:DNA-directed RNA polymerase specialized sigma24 family protein
MATVHYGRLLGSAGFSRTVAIKRLHARLAKDPDFVSMFLDEARLASRIRHPNVVPTLDVAALEGELLLVMDYVPGEPLSRLLRAARKQKRPVPLDVVSAMLCSTLHGLHAAHEATSEGGDPLHLVHRDVSPQNLLVGADGVARVIDFGVAKAAGRVSQTREGEIKGKLAYMAPEQLCGDPVDRKTDVFAAGTVLWETLTLERLFHGDAEATIVNNVLDLTIEPPSARAPGLPKALDDLTLRALDRDPDKRFESARSMALALEAAIPMASPTRVTEWVEGLVGDTLAQRAGVVAQIESDTEGLANATMEREARGHEDALGFLFDLLAPRLHDYLREAVSVPDAEYLVEQTLLRLHAARASFIQGAAVMPWAHAIAGRLAALTDGRAGPDSNAETQKLPFPSAGVHEASGSKDAGEASKSSTDVPDALKKRRLRVVAEGRRMRSPTRRQLFVQTAIYSVASLVVGISLFRAKGGFSTWQAKWPWWFVLVSVAGWLVVAVAATWGAFVRGKRMLWRPRQALLAVVILTPVVLFAWMTLWGVSCPISWPHHKVGVKCFYFTLAAAIPPLVTLIHARRGSDPVHPTATGAALGAASGAWAGVLADLWCPIGYVPHVLVGHILPILFLTALGAALGNRFVGVHPTRPVLVPREPDPG